MTELSEKILSSYQVRKTKKQKTEFIAFMKREIPSLRVEEGGFLKSRNLVVGDVKRARVVLGAHYDTCAVLPFPNLITPKNFPFLIFYGILIALPFIALMVGTELLLNDLTDNFYFAYYTALIVFFVSYFGVFMLGIPNKHTVNDNTSGVITLCEMMQICREKGIDDVAFVFFDHEETGLIGSSYFRKLHKNEMADKLLINFDCVSDGDHMLLVLNKSASERYEKELAEAFVSSEKKTVHIEKSQNTYYPSDQRGFPIAVAVSAMKKAPVLGLYLDRIHTNKDTVMDETNIAYICEGTVSLLTKLFENFQ
jgi:hypothetical protein